MRVTSFISLGIISLFALGSDFVFAVPVSAQEASPALAIDLKVKDADFTGEFGEQAELGPGEMIRFKLTITATGNVPVEGVVVRQELPAGLEIVPYSFFSNGSLRPEPREFLGLGYRIGKIQLGRPWVIIFSAKAVDNDLFSAVQTNLVSTAFVRSPRLDEVSDRVGLTVIDKSIELSKVAGVSTGRPVAPLIAPRTGAGAWIVGALAVLTTAGYWIYRKR